MAGGRGRPKKNDKQQSFTGASDGKASPPREESSVAAKVKPKRGRPKKSIADPETDVLLPVAAQETGADTEKIVADGSNTSGLGKSEADEDQRAVPQKLKVRRATKSLSNAEGDKNSAGAQLSPLDAAGQLSTENAAQNGQDAPSEPENQDLATVEASFADVSGNGKTKRGRGRPKKSSTSDQKMEAAVAAESEDVVSPRGKSISASPKAGKGISKRRKLEEAATTGGSSASEPSSPVHRLSARATRNKSELELVPATGPLAVHFIDEQIEQKSPLSRRGAKGPARVSRQERALATQDPSAAETTKPDTRLLPRSSPRKSVVSGSRKPAGMAVAGPGDAPSDGTSEKKRGRPKKVPSHEELQEASSTEVTNVTRAKNKKLEREEPKAETAVAPRKTSSARRKTVEIKEKRKRGRPKRSEAEKLDALKKKRTGTSSGEHSPTDRKNRKGDRAKSSGKGIRVGRPGRTRTTETAGTSSEDRPARGRKASKSVSPTKASGSHKAAKRDYLSTVELDEEEFHVGDDVYVTKSDGGVSESVSEEEECRICGLSNEEMMIECDGCLAGYHLKCVDPPLDSVPEGDWQCSFCTAGEKPPQAHHRSARERFLACELWAARIERKCLDEDYKVSLGYLLFARMWKDPDGTNWFTAHWYVLPEETALGRQDHNGRREIFRSNRRDENEMESILRHCYVLSPQEFKKADVGDDVYCCQYEYNEQWCKFKRIDHMDEKENADNSNDEPEESDDGTGEKVDGRKRRRSSKVKIQKSSGSNKAANKRHKHSGGLEKVGAKTIPNPVKRPQTDFDHAKAALALSAVPSSLPCRDREREEISAFLRESVGAGEKCLGRCLYISGVPGTGKTATVMEVIKELDKKVELAEMPPYRFVEVNGLRLPSPEHAYTVIHEALTGQHVGSKQALQFLDERFSNAETTKGPDARPCVILVDELDALVNRNQNVLYNIFDWPSRPQSRLIVIGIANTIDLPERLLPRIASRMGVQRISFNPYSHVELEKIISARLTGAQVFDKQAAEFVARKVAAVSGDIRRALELCRKAVENAEARLSAQNVSPNPADGASSSVGAATQEANGDGSHANGRLVSIADVDSAINEMFDAPQIQLMRRSPKLWKIFLTAMVHQHKSMPVAETIFEKVAATCSEICVSNGEESPDSDTLLDIGCKLGASRLLLCEPGALHRLQKLQLNVSCEDISFALKNDEEIPWLAKYL